MIFGRVQKMKERERNGETFLPILVARILICDLVSRLTMQGARRIEIAQLNKYLVCKVCDGYYRDAYTVSECLHTFCRQCLWDCFNGSVSTTKYCPECKISLGVKPKVVYDRNLQACVDKLFPEFLHREQEEKQQLAKEENASKRARTEPSAESSSVAAKHGTSAVRAKATAPPPPVVNTFPFVLVTMKIPASKLLENLTSATLRVQMNSELFRLKEFLIRKYSPPNAAGDMSVMEKLEFTAASGLLVQNEMNLLEVAKSSGYTQGSVDADNNSIMDGSKLILVLQGKWV